MTTPVHGARCGGEGGGGYRAVSRGLSAAAELTGRVIVAPWRRRWVDGSSSGGPELGAMPEEQPGDNSTQVADEADVGHDELDRDKLCPVHPVAGHGDPKRQEPDRRVVRGVHLVHKHLERKKDPGEPGGALVVEFRHVKAGHEPPDYRDVDHALQRREHEHGGREALGP